MKKLLLFAFLLIVLLVGFWFFYASYAFVFFAKDHQILKLSLRNSFFSQEEKEITVEIVNSKDSTELGLSGRQDLLANNEQKVDGLLFVFPKEETRNFWMKDMLFDIDICWLQHLSLTLCQKAEQPVSNNVDLKIYRSPFLTNLVLETKPNFFAKKDLNKKFFFKW